MAVGQKAVGAGSYEVVELDVEERAAEEFLGRHRLTTQLPPAESREVKTTQ